jgi:hypothetical protein
MNAAATQDQSPAGFWYEQGGPDFGYSSVHESNMRLALPRLRNRSDLFPVAVSDDAEWNLWLAANHVPQPGLATRTFLTNAGINTRTSHALQTARSRPWSEFVETSRVFAFSDAEFAASLSARRAQVSAQFGNWSALSVPSAYSYIPSFVHDARAQLDTWHPTAAGRDTADATLPCLSTSPLNLQFHDPRPTTYTMAKRPRYYAAVTTGSIRLSRQAYGLGLLWNPAFGIGLQSVAGTLSGNPWVYGTKRSGMTSTYETSNIPAAITVVGSAVSSTNGILPPGNLEFNYTLAGYGSKTITLGSETVDVSVTHSGDFSELLPLAHADDAVASASPARLILQRPNGSWLLVETTTPGASIAAGSVSSLSTGIVRRPVTITANGSLAYRITMGDSQPPPPSPSLSVADAAGDQPVSGNTVMVFPVTLSSAADSPVTVAYQTTDGSAQAGIHFTTRSGSLEFSPGETLKTIDVPLLPGTLLQGSDLSFGLALGTPSGVLAGRTSATGTIHGSTPPPPPPPGSVIVEYVPGNSWEGAYQGTFRITNSSSATITGWELDFDFSGTGITFFNGTLTQNGTRQTLKPVSWQANIGPGQKFDNLGFQASPNLPAAIPSNFLLRVTSATGGTPLQVISGALPETERGSAIAFQLAAGGGIGPYRWSFSPSATPPVGLVLSESGQLTGAVETPGIHPLAVRVTDARGISSDTNLLLNVSSPDAFNSWIGTIDWQGLDSSPHADPDADGFANFMEYALGGNPIAPDSGIRPTVEMLNGTLSLRFQRIADPTLLYEVQAAAEPVPDPASWDVIWSSTGSGNSAGPVTVSDVPPEPAPVRRFLRLRISRIGGF